MLSFYTINDILSGNGDGVYRPSKLSVSIWNPNHEF